MHDYLLVIDMNSIVGNEHARGRAIPFRVNELIKRVQTREGRRFSLASILMRDPSQQVGGLDLQPVLPGARQRIRKGDGQRWRGFGSRCRLGLQDRNTACAHCKSYQPGTHGQISESKVGHLDWNYNKLS